MCVFVVGAKKKLEEAGLNSWEVLEVGMGMVIRYPMNSNSPYRP